MLTDCGGWAGNENLSDTPDNQLLSEIATAWYDGHHGEPRKESLARSVLVDAITDRAGRDPAKLASSAKSSRAELLGTWDMHEQNILPKSSLRRSQKRPRQWPSSHKTVHLLKGTRARVAYQPCQYYSVG